MTTTRAILLLCPALLMGVEGLNVPFDDATGWTPQPSFVSVASTEASVVVAKGEADFWVPEPQRAMVWSLAKPFSVSGTATELGFRYKMANAHPGMGGVLTFDAGAAAPPFEVPVRQLANDGVWRELIVTVPKGSYTAIYLKVQSDDAGGAHLWVDHLILREPTR